MCQHPTLDAAIIYVSVYCNSAFYVFSLAYSVYFNIPISILATPFPTLRPTQSHTKTAGHSACVLDEYLLFYWIWLLPLASITCFTKDERKYKILKLKKWGLGQERGGSLDSSYAQFPLKFVFLYLQRKFFEQWKKQKRKGPGQCIGYLPCFPAPVPSCW